MSAKRLFDLILSVIVFILILIPIAVIGMAVKLTSKGPVLFISKRLGRCNSIFKMYKFRTMLTNAPLVPTHLIDNPEKYLTPIGSFLRKSSLDELPQIINILRGEMSFIGPRPALYNQNDLIKLRTEKGVHELMPGLTGWAQINGRDDLPVPVKVEFDEFYKKNRSFIFDIKILFKTCIKVLKKEGIAH
ncbi:MAG: sugar transferase [Nitrospiraceae bacterium]|nr:sugar transferase [Nitrospiraceae bacterium]